MKKLLVLFAALLTAFMGVWTIKAKTPERRLEDSEVSVSDPWWQGDNVTPVADSDWILDPEIPENYIPVPGEDELYMVVDDNGNIKEYRQRTKQEDDSCKWETVNPDIPKNYESVKGLENVYRTKNEDGTYSYYKYIRNEDDTFAFIPVDEKGKPLEEISQGENEEIPAHYVHVSGNVYAVYNEHGVLIGYKERKVDKNGKYYWIDAEKPKDTDSSYAPVPNHSNNQSSNSTNPNLPYNPSVSYPSNNENSDNTSSQNSDSSKNPTTSNGSIITNNNGTYTQTETIISNKTTGGWTVTYQTIVTKTYSSDGELLATKKEGPTEISRVRAMDSNANAPDKSKVKSTLSAEYARVNVGLSYDTDMANRVLSKINTERAASGKSALVMNTSLDAYLLSAIRAADMAEYNHTDYNSPTYGTLSEMCSKFGVNCVSPTELIWRTTSDKTVDSIASRLQIMSNGALSDSNYSSVGLSIISKGGYYYINMVLLA